MKFTLIPGTAAVLFLLYLGTECLVHAVRPSRMLEGLTAMRNAMSFANVYSEEFDFAEIFGWTGNV